jgi:hypothetical protein
LKIIGYKDQFLENGFYYIDATLIYAPSVFHKIRFMVDTGCQITTIGVRDSLPIYRYIPPVITSTSGVGGSMPTSVLSNCALAFDLLQSVHMERLSKIHVLKPPITTQNFNTIMRIPSTLGADILSRYYLSFDINSVTLEK